VVEQPAAAAPVDAFQLGGRGALLTAVVPRDAIAVKGSMLFAFPSLTADLSSSQTLRQRTVVEGAPDLSLRSAGTPAMSTEPLPSTFGNVPLLSMSAEIRMPPAEIRMPQSASGNPLQED
jgi:hypothetical protein